MGKLSRGFASNWVAVTLTLLFVVAPASSSRAAGDSAKFPEKPMTLIVQFPAGGSTDLACRNIAENLSKVLGQPVVVENRPGAGGATAFSVVAKARPDGYTFGTVSGSVVIVPAQRAVPFDPKKDFTWLANVFDHTFGFSVAAGSRWKTLKQFVEEAKENPGKLSIASGGTAKGLMHMLIAEFILATGTQINYVPTQGGAEATTLLLGGHVQATVSGEMQNVSSGTTRALAILSQNRLAALPDVPTFADLGYHFECPNWLGLIAPKGVDPEIRKKLAHAIGKAVSSPSYKELCAKMYANPRFVDSEPFEKFVLGSFDRQIPLLKKIGFVD